MTLVSPRSSRGSAWRGDDKVVSLVRRCRFCPRGGGRGEVWVRRPRRATGASAWQARHRLLTAMGGSKTWEGWVRRRRAGPGAMASAAQTGIGRAAAARPAAKPPPTAAHTTWMSALAPPSTSTGSRRHGAVARRRVTTTLSGGGGDGASRATPFGGGLRYNEDAPSSMRRGAPADIPCDVGGWARTHCVKQSQEDLSLALKRAHLTHQITHN